MTLDDIYDTLAQLERTKSRNDKIALLKDALGDEFFRAVCVYAYDPYRTFGISLPDNAILGDETLYHIDSLGDLLNKLARRELSGNAAKDAVSEFADSLTLKSQTVIQRILAKDLRCGITAKTINQACPGLIPVFSVMLAQKYDPDHNVFPVAVEPKLDGVRVTCVIDGASASFFSRTGKEFPAINHLADDVLHMVERLRQIVENDEGDFAQETRCFIWDYTGGSRQRLILDGEVVSGSFNKTVSDVRRKSERAEDAHFRLFDAVSIEDWEGVNIRVAGASYNKRRRVLKYLENEIADENRLSIIPSYQASSDWEIQHYYKKFRARGLEGAMVKCLSGQYERRRSGLWQKIKNEDTVDLVITAVFEGEGKYAGQLGGVIVDFNGVEVRVGGGFTDAQRIELWEMPPLGRMIEVEYHEITPDGSLRHPRFVRFRDDKHSPDDD